MKIKQNQKGIAHILLLFNIVLIIAVSVFVFIQIRNKITENSNPSRGENVSKINPNIDKVDGTSVFKGNNITYNYPKNWGDISTITVKYPLNYDDTYRTDSDGQFSFSKLGEENFITYWKSSNALLGSTGGSEIESCRFDTKTKNWEVDNNFIKKDLYPKGEYFYKCPYKEIKKYNGIKIFDTDPKSKDSHSIIFEIKNSLIKIEVFGNDNDILKDSESSGCCSTPPIYKDGYEKRLKSTVLTMAYKLIDLNK